MTEQEWLTSDDPQAMLLYLTHKFVGSADEEPRQRPLASDRKLRLYGCACCRSVWHLLTDERSRKAVEVAEQYADGLATKEELFTANTNAYHAWGQGFPTSNPAGLARYASVSSS